VTILVWFDYFPETEQGSFDIGSSPECFPLRETRVFPGQNDFLSEDPQDESRDVG
jgi:hypothetical protein